MSNLHIDTPSPGVTRVVLDRPDVRNALDNPTFVELRDALHRLSAAAETRCLVLTGAAGHFSAGGDLRAIDQRRALPVATNRERVGEAQQAALALLRFPAPTLAAIQGSCVGAGASLALCCDRRLATRDAVFGFGFTRVGLVPDCGATLTLPRLVGVGRAYELFLSGRRLDADEALALGLVERLVDTPAELLAEAQALAAGPTATYAALKRVFLANTFPDLESALAREADAQALCFASRDCGEGVAAFLARRAPRFEGR